MDACTVYVISEGSHWIIRNGEKLRRRYNFTAQSICCAQACKIVESKEKGSFILDLENAFDPEAMLALINFIDAATMRGEGYWPTTILVQNEYFAYLANAERHDWIWVHARGEGQDDLRACIEHVVGLRPYSHYRVLEHRRVLQVLAQ